MMLLINSLLLSLAVYAILKWWFDTSLIDYLVYPLGVSFQEFKAELSDKGKVGQLLVELFECPWCLSFHFALWLSLTLSLCSGFQGMAQFLLQSIAAAGGGMFLWQNDLKD